MPATPLSSRLRLTVLALSIGLLFPQPVDAVGGRRPLTSLPATSTVPGLDSWAREHPAWSAFVDAEHGRPTQLVGPSFVVVTPSELHRAKPRIAALIDIAAAFDFDPRTLSFERAHRIGPHTVLRYTQSIDGLRVFDAFLRLVIDSDTGRLMAASARGARASANIENGTDTHPSDVTGVGTAVANSLDGTLSSIENGWRVDGRGVAVPCTQLRVHRDRRAPLDVRIDPRTGELLDVTDNIAHGTFGGSTRGHATAGWDPDAQDGDVLAFPLAHAQLTSPTLGIHYADAEGEYSIAGSGSSAEITAHLVGPWAYIIDDTGPPLTVTRTVSAGTPETLLIYPGVSEQNRAQINAFYHTNAIHDWVSGITIDPPFTDLDSPLQVCVNRQLVGHCNAGFDPNIPEMYFMPSGDGCPNTAYSTIIYHEYGHAIAWQIFGTFTPLDMHEAIADCASVLMSGAGVVGRDFYGLGDDLRDIERDRVYPLVGAVHIRGLPYSGAVYDMRTRFIGDYGFDAGNELIDRLWLSSLYYLPTGLNDELVTTFLLADDDDGDLANGTPHFDTIVECFALHGFLYDPIDLSPIRQLDHLVLPDAVHFYWLITDTFDEIRVTKNGVLVAILPGTQDSWIDEASTPGISIYTFTTRSGALSGPTAPQWVAQRSFVRGDIDGNHALDIGDAVTLLEQLMTPADPLSCIDASDLDDSGSLEITDAVYLLEYLFTDGPNPASPFPSANPDPSNDFLICGGEL